MSPATVRQVTHAVVTVAALAAAAVAYVATGHVPTELVGLASACVGGYWGAAIPASPAPPPVDPADLAAAQPGDDGQAARHAAR